MSSTLKKPNAPRPSYNDIVKLPAHLRGEIICGELFASPRPSTLHSFIDAGLGSEIIERFQMGRGGCPGGWWVFSEPEIHFGKDQTLEVMVPDLTGYRKERMPSVPNVPYFEASPDWVCEILSPSTRRLDRVIKLPRYAVHGVKYLWLIEPESRTLEVFRLENTMWVLLLTAADDDKVRAEPFHAVEISLANLWGER